MSAPTDTELYRRGIATLVASWEEYAREASNARLRRFPGGAVAVFPNEPEHSLYNNAMLRRDLSDIDGNDALDAIETCYAAARITRFAVWVHETHEATHRALERRGYTFDSATRAMGMALDDIHLPRPWLDLAPQDWTEYLRVIEVSPNLLSKGDHDAFHVLIARLDGESVAAGMGFDFDGDCGIYNVGTLEHARRRGLGTAVTATLALDARARGCRTASLPVNRDG